MIEVVPYETGHLGKLNLKDCHREEELACGGDFQPGGGSLTFMRKGTPIAILGGHIIGLGVLQVWGLVGKEVKDAPLDFHRSVKVLIEHWFDRLRLHRMQMSVKCGYADEAKWAQKLGFKLEGIMKNYGPDKSDYWLYARTE